MNNERLRQLAGMKHPEGTGSEMLQEMNMQPDGIRALASRVYQLAEENAYSESEGGRQSVSGDLIYRQYERIKQQLDQHVEEMINRGNTNA